MRSANKSCSLVLMRVSFCQQPGHHGAAVGLGVGATVGAFVGATVGA
jgi:hypothetical protein